MQIYIDENLPPQLAQGLNILEKPNKNECAVISIRDAFGKGTPDEEWLPKIGALQGVVITQDKNIYRNAHQREIYRSHGVGIFFFHPPSKNGYTYWEMVENIVKRWADIIQICKSEKRPFSYKITSQKSKPERF